MPLEEAAGSLQALRSTDKRSLSDNNERLHRVFEFAAQHEASRG